MSKIGKCSENSYSPYSGVHWYAGAAVVRNVEGADIVSPRRGSSDLGVWSLEDVFREVLRS